ncbi:hypothetical protein ACTWP6_29015 [Mycobacterium sp. 4D054]|uniref:hypothetical protein n=1 Tax=unclassified Mycobacterium TaxID=2642494 RepID=UPI0021B420C0|nr:hypothetical protein [Mycobacterium sp. SMC-8]UXA09973.1 hypothetical protein KXD97_17420 [Mycobacterium sp. SMC-8]
MSTTAEVVLIIVLVFGIVLVIFAAIYAWKKWVNGTWFEQRIDRFFDRLNDLFGL